jgi:hypothetical protein
MTFRVLAVFLLAVRPVLGTAIGWFANPLDDPVFAPSRLETVPSSGWRPLPTG